MIQPKLTIIAIEVDTSTPEEVKSIKSQGTAKINAYCTAAMVVTQKEQQQDLQVNVCTSHYGHSISMGHIRLKEEDRYISDNCQNSTRSCFQTHPR